LNLLVESTRDIREFLRGDEETLVVTHHSPDGDAIGSLTAFGGMLDQLCVPNVIAVDDTPPMKYSFLPGFDRIVNLKAHPVGKMYPRVVVLDAGALERIGQAKSAIGPGTRILNIDHHFTGEAYGHINLVEVAAAATSEILYEICAAWGLEITPQIAYGLYVGILTDTGRFRFANTTARSVEICSKLIALGVDTSFVTERVYFNMSVDAVRALAKALTSLEFYFDSRVALIGLGGANHSSETEGFVEHACSIDGVVLAGFYSEMEPGLFKVSLRSRGRVDVNQIAAGFGGGGHKKAAGYRFRGDLADLKNSLMQAFKVGLDADLQGNSTSETAGILPWGRSTMVEN